MPALGSGPGSVPVHVKLKHHRRPRPAPRRVVVRRTPAPQIRRPDFAQAGPSRRTRRTVIHHRPAPSPSRQRQLSRIQARTYHSQAKQLKVQARRQRHVAALQMIQSRRRFFPKDPIKALGHSERRAISNLAALHAQDPEGYKQRAHESHDTHIGPFNLTAELEGRGVAQKAAGGLKSAVERFHARTTPDSFKRMEHSGVGGIGGTTAAKEIIDLTANTPSGLYLAGAAGAEAAQGSTGRANKLWRDYKKSSAVVAAAEGKWGEAAKRANEHPVATALELSGGKAIVGRGAGAIMRHAPSSALRRAASTERANLRLYPHAKPGEGPEIQRRYSKDVINKAAQRAVEKHDLRRRRDPNVDYGSRLSPGLPRRMGGSATPGTARHSRLVRRIDTRVFSQDRIAQHRKATAEHDVRKLLRRHKKTAAGVQLVAEGTVRVGRIRRDLKVRLGRLAKSRQGLKDPERLRLNRQEAKHIRELLALPDERLAQVAEASGAFVRSQAGVQARGLRAGSWTAVGQSKRRLPYLQSHVRRPKGEERRAYTPEEIQIAAKKLSQRTTKGKPVPSRLAAEALMESRKRGRDPIEHPAAGLIRAEIVAAMPELMREVAVRKPKVGASKGIRRADFAAALKGVKRRVSVPARPLTQEELALAARTAERVSRRRGEVFSDVPEGGPTIISQRPGARMGSTRLRAVAPFEPLRERSGRALEEGSREVGARAMEHQAVSAEAQVTAAEGHNLLVREFGIPAGKDGKRYAETRDSAIERARMETLDEHGQPKPDAIPLVPVNVAQFQTFGPRLRAKQEQGMPRSYAGINDIERQALDETWAAALNESGRGKWILMPEPVVQRLREHASVGNFGPAHSLSNLFKDVVLTSSSPARWIGGNVSDIAMRTAFAGITPFDIARGRMVVRNAARRGTQGEQAASAVSGGGLYHASEALNRSMRPSGVEEHLARTVAAAPWRAWKGGVYALEHMIEELPQWGAVGKAMRQETSRQASDLKSLLKLHDQQIDHFAKNLATDRAFEARIQKLTEDVIGRWGKVSPNMRRALLIAPFAQWLGAATRYVFVTLPVHHPIKTGIIAGIMEMTDQERRALGLSYFLPRDKQVQDYQMGSLPMSVGKNKYGPVVMGVRTQRMTSLGTAAQAAGGDVGGFLLPQFAGALDAWAGTSFTHEQLVYPDWWPDQSLVGIPLPPDARQKVGLGALLESVVPFASAIRRQVLDKGAPSEPYSTILTPAVRKKFDKETKTYTENKGTTLGGIMEWLSPVAPKQRLYTYGAGKAITEQGITGRTLDKWRTLPKHAKGYGFSGGATTAPTEDYGFGERGLGKKKDKGYGF